MGRGRAEPAPEGDRREPEVKRLVRGRRQQQQLLFPQPLSQPQPLPQPLPLPLPQQQHRTMMIRMIQMQELFPPKHIVFTPFCRRARHFEMMFFLSEPRAFPA